MRWKDETKTVLIVTVNADDSMRRLCKQAVMVQDACNLCGVAQSFAKVMVELLRHPQNSVGTEWANQHIITKVWIDKLCHLAGLNQPDVTSPFMRVMDINDGKDVEMEIEVNSSDRDTFDRIIADALADKEARRLHDASKTV